MIEDRYTLLLGDCRKRLRELPDCSVHTCITSPPYFGLRDYGHEEQIGLEETPEEYVENLVEAFREVRRVLRDDGTLWVNLGDSYANDGKWGGSSGGKHVKALHGDTGVGRGKVLTGLKPKDLIGIPWRVAFALQADGWYLRQDIIWKKPNPMPESVRDRCTRSHEYIFLLTKSARYYFDAEAIKEPAVSTLPAGNGFNGRQGSAGHLPMSGGAGSKEPWTPRSARDNFKRADSKRAQAIPGQAVGTHRDDRPDSDYDLSTRNRRSVWTVSTKPFKGAHFATFPPALIEPCILAGCPEGGVVLDIFGGSGTTAGVAIANGRTAILCELNPEYGAMTPNRVRAIVETAEQARSGRRPRRAPDPVPNETLALAFEFD